MPSLHFPKSPTSQQGYLPKKENVLAGYHPVNLNSQIKIAFIKN